jgi:hypothetical protein
MLSPRCQYEEGGVPQSYIALAWIDRNNLPPIRSIQMLISYKTNGNKCPGQELVATSRAVELNDFAIGNSLLPPYYQLRL